MTLRFKNQFTGEKVTIINEFIVDGRVMIGYKKDHPVITYKESPIGTVVGKTEVDSFVKPKTVFDKVFIPN